MPYPDLIICAVAVALFYRLRTLPPNSLVCRVLAVLSGCMIVGIIIVLLLFDNLSRAGVFELAAIGLGLAIGLGKWNDARLKSSVASEIPAQSLK